jgi:hypothetical protein
MEEKIKNSIYNNPKAWYVIAAILFILVIAIYVNSPDTDQKSETDIRVDRLNELRAQSSAVNDMTVKERLDKNEALVDDQTPQDQTVDERLEALNKLRNNSN